jgi:rhodanese-related sulfurtransferase
LKRYVPVSRHERRRCGMKRIMELLGTVAAILGAALASLAGCVSGEGGRGTQMKVVRKEVGVRYMDITAREAADLLEKSKPLLLDVRTPGEYSQGHIKDARLIPLQQLESRWREIDAYKDKDVVIYCRSGHRSVAASEMLVGHGFTKLHNLRNGIKGWQKAGQTVVTY